MKEDWKELIKKNLKWVVLFICLVGFLALAEDVFNKEIMYGDIIGYKLISTFLISDFVTPIAKFITNFGGAIFLSIATVMLFLFIKNKKNWAINYFEHSYYCSFKSVIEKNITKTKTN